MFAAAALAAPRALAFTAPRAICATARIAAPRAVILRALTAKVTVYPRNDHLLNAAFTPFIHANYHAVCSP